MVGSINLYLNNMGDQNFSTHSHPLDLQAGKYDHGMVLSHSDSYVAYTRVHSELLED